MLREKIKETLNDAMRAKQARRVATLRLILAAVKDRDIALRVEDATELDDDALILGILGKMIKQRGDSIKAYEEGGRLELAEQERQEIEIINEFLPEQMSEAEAGKACQEAVKETGEGVVINAIAPDGVIEGIEDPRQRFCIGVEWHPEFAISVGDEKIFKAFIDACG